MDDLLTSALELLLQRECPAARVRAVEADPAAAAPLWNVIEDSGFADALVAEAQGDAGQTLADAFELFALCGQYALPVPLAQTAVARALLADAGVAIPRGAIALTCASAVPAGSGGVECAVVQDGRVANWVLLQAGPQTRLLSVGAAQVREDGLFPLDAAMVWPRAAWESAARIEPVPDLVDLQALVCAALIAGALHAVFAQTLRYANEREQFGRPIGKFQAIQHQLSVMAEHVFAARVAVQLGCCGTVQSPDRLRVAIAKARASEAAHAVAAAAHAIHGAIGFTAEFDLQLFTRRLHMWRRVGGSEGAWQAVAGRLLVESAAVRTLDVIRAATDTASELQGDSV